MKRLETYPISYDIMLNKEDKPLMGDTVRERVTEELYGYLRNKAVELLTLVTKKDFGEWTWESPETTPRLHYTANNLLTFTLHTYVGIGDYHEECFFPHEITCIGFDVDNIFFIDKDDHWYELDDLNIDELCCALNNIDVNIRKILSDNKK